MVTSQRKYQFSEVILAFILVRRYGNKDSFYAVRIPCSIHNLWLLPVNETCRSRPLIPRSNIKVEVMARTKSTLYHQICGKMKRRGVSPCLKVICSFICTCQKLNLMAKFSQHVAKITCTPNRLAREICFRQLSSSRGKLSPRPARKYLEHFLFVKSIFLSLFPLFCHEDQQKD